MKIFFTGICFALAICSFSCTNKSTDEKQTRVKNELKVEYIEGTAATLGEGSIWDHNKAVLYWIDIQEKKIHEYDPGEKEHTSWELPYNIGTIVPESNNTVIVALKDGIYRKYFSPDSLEFIARPESLKEEERFNDGKCDPEGRLWVGSMRIKGKLGDSFLYKYDPERGFQEMADSISISNGIIWSLNGKKMYYIDTPTRKIMQYDFNAEKGEISKGKVAVEIADTLGHPDGMTIDEEGKLWVGMWAGNAVCCFDPETGELIRRIEVPARNVTSCAFGGKDLDILFITTASAGMNDEQREKYPKAGGLFMVEPGVKGVKANFYRGGK